MIGCQGQKSQLLKNILKHSQPRQQSNKNKISQLVVAVKVVTEEHLDSDRNLESDLIINHDKNLKNLPVIPFNLTMNRNNSNANLRGIRISRVQLKPFFKQFPIDLMLALDSQGVARKRVSKTKA